MLNLALLVLIDRLRRIASCIGGGAFLHSRRSRLNRSLLGVGPAKFNRLWVEETH